MYNLSPAQFPSSNSKCNREFMRGQTYDLVFKEKNMRPFAFRHQIIIIAIDRIRVHHVLARSLAVHSIKCNSTSLYNMRLFRAASGREISLNDFSAKCTRK